jgi:hypothetical protein
MRPGQNEAFSRVLIDKALEFSGWNLLDQPPSLAESLSVDAPSRVLWRRMNKRHRGETTAGQDRLRPACVPLRRGKLGALFQSMLHRAFTCANFER